MQPRDTALRVGDAHARATSRARSASCAAASEDEGRARSAQEEARVLAGDAAAGGRRGLAGARPRTTRRGARRHAGATSRSCAPPHGARHLRGGVRRAGVPFAPRAAARSSSARRCATCDRPARDRRPARRRLARRRRCARARSAAPTRTSSSTSPPATGSTTRAAERRGPRQRARGARRAARPARPPLARLAGAARARDARAHAARRGRAARLRRQAGGREPAQARRPGARLQRRGRRRPRGFAHWLTEQRAASDERRGDRRRGDRRRRADHDDPRVEGARVPDRRAREPRHGAAQRRRARPRPARHGCTCASRPATAEFKTPGFDGAWEPRATNGRRGEAPALRRGHAGARPPDRPRGERAQGRVDAVRPRRVAGRGRRAGWSWTARRCPRCPRTSPSWTSGPAPWR